MELKEEGIVAKRAEEAGINRLLLQAWRDYYDEILFIDPVSGTFRSMMASEDSSWTQGGFVNIEMILLAEKRVHPDDKETFSEFFDFDRVNACTEEGIFVSKLNFRLKGPNDEYYWIKAKIIVPTNREEDDQRFFVCFRRTDRETDDELKYKQEINDALEQERTFNRQKREAIEKFSHDVRTPLNAIRGLTKLATSGDCDAETLQQRMKGIEEASIRIEEAIKIMLEVEETDDTTTVMTNNRSVNEINYSHKKADQVHSDTEKEEEADVSEIPEDYVVTNLDRNDKDTEETYDFKGIRILIVEDNALNEEVMKELIEGTGAEADVAEDGKQAVIKFVSKPAGYYDIILMDIDIPILDGYSATKCIRMAGKEDSGTVPVFAVTSNNFNEDIVKSYEYGFSAFFAKPVDFGLLFRKIAEKIKERK